MHNLPCRNILAYQWRNRVYHVSDLWSGVLQPLGLFKLHGVRCGHGVSELRSVGI